MPSVTDQRPFTIWEEYEEDWERAVRRDDKDELESIWYQMVWAAKYHEDVLPEDLLPWNFFKGKEIKLADQKDGVAPTATWVKLHDIGHYVKTIAEWSREEQKARYRR